MNERACVYIVEDDEGVRLSLSRLIEAEGYEVISLASGRELLEVLQPRGNACLLLDIRLPDMSGLELLEKLATSGVEIPAIIITGHGDVPLAVKAIKIGAHDFLQKPFDTNLLLERIREALELGEQRWTRRAKLSEVSARVARLSPREREVMDMVVAGMPNKIIAAKLGLSSKTVENHRAHLMKKMEVNSLAELAQLAVAERGRS